MQSIQADEAKNQHQMYRSDPIVEALLREMSGIVNRHFPVLLYDATNDTCKINTYDWTKDDDFVRLQTMLKEYREFNYPLLNFT